METVDFYNNMSDDELTVYLERVNTYIEQILRKDDYDRFTDLLCALFVDRRDCRIALNLRSE